VIIPDGRLRLPCCACRELLMQLGKDSENIEILTDFEKRSFYKLRKLVPQFWGSEYYNI